MSIQTSPRIRSPRSPFGLASVLTVALVFALATGTAAAKPLSRGDRAFVASEVAALMKAGKLPGASIEVSGPEGSYTKAYGVSDLADDSPYRLNDHVRIASITKTFTATAILRQGAEGKLDLDAPIVKWFPHLPNAKSITVRDLLAMRSGL